MSEPAQPPDHSRALGRHVRARRSQLTAEILEALADRTPGLPTELVDVAVAAAVDAVIGNLELGESRRAADKASPDLDQVIVLVGQLAASFPIPPDRVMSAAALVASAITTAIIRAIDETETPEASRHFEYQTTIDASHQFIQRFAREYWVALMLTGEPLSRWERLVRQVGVGIVELDESARVRYLNPEAAELLRTQAETAVGRMLPDLLDTRHGVHPHAGWTERREDDVRVVHATGIATSDGDVVELEIRSVPYEERARGETGSILVIRDRTAEAQLERMQDSFLSTVSHELRTPLTAIKGFAHTLRDRGERLESAEREYFLSAIGDKVDMLSRLIDEITVFATLNAGQVRLDVRPHRLLDIVDAAVLGLGTGSAERVQVAVEPTLRVLCDAHRMQQVLINLVRNALVHGGGGAWVEAVCAHGEVHVHVDDEGAGIPPAARELIFRRFHRLDPRHSKGLGIGLSIAHAIVEAHRGRIWTTESPQHGGARFTFTMLGA